MDERRGQLLELGLVAFGRRAYEDVSIDDIATEAGISKGLLYHYFPTKRAFYVEAVREAARRLLVSTQTASEGEPLGQLEAGLGAYLRFVEEHATAYVTLMRGAASDPDIREIIDATRAEFVARLTVGLPGAPPPWLRLTLVGWVGFVEAAALDWLERGGMGRDELRALLVHALLTLAQGPG